MVEYGLLTQKMYNRACGFYTTYGIVAFEGEKRLLAIGDISVNKDHVESLIKKFNDSKLELCHLRQAVEDYLYDLCVD